MAGGGGNPVTNLQIGHAFADSRNHTGNFSARRERPRRLELVHVLNDQHIGIVDRTSFDINDNLSLAGNRIGDVQHLQRVGSAHFG